MLFTELPLHERLQRALQVAGYTEPTPIQAAALPAALAGEDIVGTAQTGTGKTAAFVLPILQRMLASEERSRHTRALILTPTRELAEQIHDVIRKLGAHTNIRSATVYGGVGMMPQERALRNGTEIIVACPGRLLDHVGRGNADLSQVDFLVLDEADRMLDMGFLPPITRIISSLPRQRQTMLYSATFAPELQSFVDRTLRDAQRIDIGMAAPAETVAHALYPVPQHLKTALLLEVLQKTPTQSVLVFTRTKHRANRVAEQLLTAGHAAGVLHSNKSQNQRQQALDDFRAGKMRVLVATDIAARGIDVRTISHVVNYDVPDCADSYIHRIGRTGRMAATGEALTFVTGEDRATVRDIERILGARIASETLPDFDYQQVKPAGDEFRRAPQPPRRSSAKPASGGRPQSRSFASATLPPVARQKDATTQESSGRPKGSTPKRHGGSGAADARKAGASPWGRTSRPGGRRGR
jgi:ATP-dependent RNA helicase RhlE